MIDVPSRKRRLARNQDYRSQRTYSPCFVAGKKWQFEFRANPTFDCNSYDTHNLRFSSNPTFPQTLEFTNGAIRLLNHKGRWLRWADQDYVAARTLLLKGLLVQGCGLANTAVEKYFKAVLVLNGSSSPKGVRGHDVVHLYEKLPSAGIDRGLNIDFLRVLLKAYRMRYPDDLEVGFNIALEQVKVLAEIDTAVHAIRKGFQFHQQKTEGPTSLEALIESKSHQSWRKKSKSCVTNF